MRLDDLLRISFRQVIRQRRRNFGVCLSIALGTAGLIVVITMGQDVRSSVNRDLELLGGVTRIKVVFDNYSKKNDMEPLQYFTRKSARLLADLANVEAAALVANRNGKIETNWNANKYNLKLVGVDQHFWEVNGFRPLKGEFISAQHEKNRELVCVLGINIAKMIFGSDDAIGQYLRIDKDMYRIIGLLGGLGVSDRAEWLFVPMTTAHDRISQMLPPDHLYVRCRTWDDVEEVAAVIPGKIQTQQSIERLRVIVARAHLKRVKRMAWIIEHFVNLAVISTLILGGFGIWNIMMASVRSRTREIGLKKSVGAEDKDILKQFLTEAVCISLGSALVGVILGRLGVVAMADFLGSSPPEDLFLLCVLFGLFFAILLGVGAGLFPSIKASRMEVVAAVRYE